MPKENLKQKLEVQLEDSLLKQNTERKNEKKEPTETTENQSIGTITSKEKKKKNKDKIKEETKEKETKQQLGSTRGIESLFRNSYRAQLDMITLAATKANIMISLNGILVSVLIVSSAYFMDADPMLIIPFTAFLLTCTTAVVFAVLAARPLIDRQTRSVQEFRTDKADLLIFEQFAKLPRDEYVDAMLEMVRNNDRIYRTMVVHLHDLGYSANRAFSRLYISYSAFMIGLVISVILLFIVIGRSALSGA